MTYSGSNTNLVEFAFAGPPDKHGDATFLAFDFTAPSVYQVASGIPTWIDTKIARVAEVFQTDSPIRATWESRKWELDAIEVVIGRPVRVGDMVRFSSHPDQWFLIRESQVDSGMFGGNPVTKFNLARSDKRP